MKESSVSPDRWLVMMPHPASFESRTCTGKPIAGDEMGQYSRHMSHHCKRPYYKASFILASHRMFHDQCLNTDANTEINSSRCLPNGPQIWFRDYV